MTQLLENRNVIVYGAGGGIGGGVARAFAREGARVFLTGRTRAALDRLAADITAEGGHAEVAVVDALDEQAVEEHLRAVVNAAGSVDVSINLISRGDVQGAPLLEMSAADFTRPVTTGLLTNFLTARAAARWMTKQGSGVVLYLTSGSSEGTAPMMGGTGPADAATEAFMRYLAAEVGRSGVRVVGMWTAGVPETFEGGRFGMGPDDIDRTIGAMAALGRAPRLAQVADTAVFLASDRAAAITGTIVNVTCGLVLNP